MEQPEIPVGPLHIYGARVPREPTIRDDRAVSFVSEISLGFDTVTRSSRIVLRGVRVPDGTDTSAACMLKFEELMSSCEGNILLEYVDTEAESTYVCDVWFAPKDGPQYLSLANSLVNTGVCEPVGS